MLARIQGCSFLFYVFWQGRFRLAFFCQVVLLVWLLPKGFDGRVSVVSLAILRIAAHSEYFGHALRLGKELQVFVSCSPLSIS